MRVLYKNSILVKVLAATVSGFLVLILVFQYLLHEQQDSELQLHLKDNFNMLQNEIDSSIYIRSGWMENSLLLFQHSGNVEKLVSALQLEERESLYLLALDYYRSLKKYNHITHMYFVDSKRKVVLRMHQPDRFGDIIERKSVRDADENGVTSTGIELGQLGTLTLRVVVPWIHDGKTLGFLELGMELEEILNSIEKDSPFTVMLTLNKEQLEQSEWQLGQKMLKRNADWNQLEQRVLAYPVMDIGRLPAAVVDFLNEPDLRHKLVQFDGVLYGLEQHPFVDMAGVEVGQLGLLIDLSGQSSSLKRGLYLTMMLFVLLVAVIVLLLYLMISRAEKARDQAEAELRLASEVLAQTADGVMITDSRGYIIDVNAAFEHVTGFSRDEALGNKPGMLSSGEHDKQFYREMWASIKEQGQWRGRIVNRRKGGETYPEHLSITAVRNEQGAVKHYIGVFSDITDQEEMEQQFHEAQRMESLGTLVGGIAHEFNNLLAGMTGNLYLAMGDIKEQPEAIEKLKTVERISFHAAELIRQLLSFASKGVMSTEVIEVNQFINEGITLHRMAVPENINLRYQPSAKQLMVEIDRVQFQQVLLNLLKNAVDALAGCEKPEITIASQLYIADKAFKARHVDIKDDRLWCLSIADNGCGIGEEELNVVFEPFFTTKEVGEGTGLGLSMVFGAVKSHGGVVEVDSRAGAGAEFRIYCPLHEVVEVSKPDTYQVLKGDGETILVVDDDRLVIDTASKVLKRLGYNVLTANDGLAALELFQQKWQKIDLVMLDLVMPGLGGRDTACAMRKISSDTKIIFVTGYDEMKTTHESMQGSGDFVLHKPYSITQLSRVLNVMFKRA